jgi:electron transfer flavoprotein alpha subunit
MTKTHAKKKPKKTGKTKERGPVSPTSWQGVWVLGDVRSEAQRKMSLRLLKRAKALAALREQELSLVLLGRHLKGSLDPFLAAGPDRIYIVDHPRLKTYRQETYTGVLEALVERHRPEIFLLLANDCGRELAPRVAARLGTGLCADCIRLEIDPETGHLLQRVPAFGDHVYANIVTPEKRPQMATVRPGALPETEAQPLPGTPPEVIRVPLPGGLPGERIRLLGSERETTAGKALEDARTVICGGRGMGTKKRFQSLWDLASLLGGEVGATRPAVHAQWIDEDCMVGQTGREVSPEFLLLFGISGASQFTAAVQQSKYIVAVNKDPKAAILPVVDLGVVGDAKQIIPALLGKVQKTLIEQYGRSPEEVFARAGVAVRGDLGDLVKELRERRGYERNETARALDMTSRELEKIEKNEETPSVSFLLRIAQLFRVDPAPFLTQAEGARSDRKRVESFSKRTQNYSYRTLTPGAEQKHLRAFQITIDPGRDHKMVEYKHEGEEFVYVLRGEVEIKVGEELHGLRRGDTLHFEGSIPHHLRNPSQKKTDLIVVLYTP